MGRIKIAVAGALAALLLACQAVWAHSPICNCYDNGDGSVTCEGGFSDGSSAAGVAIRIVDARDRVLIDGRMEDDGTFSFAKPDQEFHVVFDAGQSHLVTIFGEDIE
jgi:hypothetical protein